MRIQRHTRTAFTLVEMMVAVALTLFIMAIIAQAFGSAQKTFSAMRTAGQLQERMRQGAQVIRKDLSAEHFDGPFIAGRTGPRVGDQRMDLPGWMPPPRGHFELRQFPVPNFSFVSYPEPIVPWTAATPTPIYDGEGIVSTRADTHVLRFTIKLSDLPATELFSAELPRSIPVVPVGPGAPVANLADNSLINSFPIGSGIIYSRWAEVQYFLRPNGETTPQTANGPALPRYSLRRRVRVLAPAGWTVTPVGSNQPALIPAADADRLMRRHPDVAMARSPGPNNMVFMRILGPDDVNYPGTPQGSMDPYRMPYLAYSQKMNNAGQMYETGDDILITDVLSFEVKAAWFANQMNPPFEAIRASSSPPTPTMALGNTEAPFSDLPPQPRGPAFNEPLALNPTYAGQRAFDTWFLDPQASDFIDWGKYQPQTGQMGFLTPHPVQPPMRINVRALQIKIRVWDAEKQQARQVTIVQEI